MSKLDSALEELHVIREGLITEKGEALSEYYHSMRKLEHLKEKRDELKSLLSPLERVQVRDREFLDTMKLLKAQLKALEGEIRNSANELDLWSLRERDLKRRLDDCIEAIHVWEAIKGYDSQG